MTWRSTTLRFALLVFALQVIAGATLMLMANRAARSAWELSATQRADALRDDLLADYSERGLAGLTEAVRARSARGGADDSVVLLTNAAGAPLAGNLAAWPREVGVNAKHAAIRVARTDHPESETMWLRGTRFPGGTRMLTGLVIEDETRLLRAFEGAAILGAVVAVLFAGLAAWLAARMIAGRLARTVATLEAVRDGDLSRRVVEDRSGDAFAALAGSVNTTLARIDQLVSELRIVTDGLAHDLKSPLTRLRSTLEKASASSDPIAQTAIARALADSDQLVTIVDTTLTITRAEAGIGRELFVETDITALLEDIAEIYGPVVEGVGRSMAVPSSVAYFATVHRELLARALGNLVDNALKYGAGAIVLELSAAIDGFAITVSDSGPGILAEQRDEALTRFARLDRARRRAGAGLGLTLVRAVVELHGGKVELSDANPGLIVSLNFTTPKSTENNNDRLKTAM